MYTYAMKCESIKRAKHYSHAGTPEEGHQFDNIPYVFSRAPTGKKKKALV